MGTQLARFEQFLKRRIGKRPAEIALEPQLLQVATAYDAVVEAGELSEANLQFFVDAMRSPYMLLWDGASELLGRLAGRFPLAADAVVALAAEIKAHVRFAALCAVSSAMPKETVGALLRAGLKDRSANVRWKASDRLRLLERRDLLPELAAAASGERNPRAAASLNFDLPLLRDGFILEQSKSGGYDLTVATPRVTSSRWISEEYVSLLGIDRIVNEIRDSLEKQHPRKVLPVI